MLDRLIDLLVSRAPLILASGVFAGLLVPPVASFMRPLLVPSVFILLVAMFFNLDWRMVGAYLRRPGLASALLAWLLLVSPIVAWGVTAVVPLPAPVAAAIVLMTTCPPIISSASFAEIMRLDPPLAMLAVFVATLVAPFSAPFFAIELVGIDLGVGFVPFMVRLSMLALGALAVSILLRLVIPGHARQRADRILMGVTVLMLVTFAVAIMDGVQETALARPVFMLTMTAAAFAANYLLQFAGALLFVGAGWHRALTAGFVSGNRNMAIMLAALSGIAEFDLLLYFAVAQIPMYLTPAIAAPVHRWVLARTAGAAPER